MTYSEEKYNALLAVCNSYKNDYDNAFERLKAQQREIDGLRAENVRLTTKLGQVLLSIDTVKEMNTMCSIDEQRKQAKIDVLNELTVKAVSLSAIETYHICNLVDELIKEIEK